MKDERQHCLQKILVKSSICNANQTTDALSLVRFDGRVIAYMKILAKNCICELASNVGGFPLLC
jgi:hypothetical protein